MASGSKSHKLPDIRPSSLNAAEAEADTEADADADAEAQTRASASARDVMSRRRKAPDSVTPNACTNCKKARAKVIDILFDSMRHGTWCDDKTE